MSKKRNCWCSKMNNNSAFEQPIVRKGNNTKFIPTNMHSNFHAGRFGRSSFAVNLFGKLLRCDMDVNSDCFPHQHAHVQENNARNTHRRWRMQLVTNVPRLTNVVWTQFRHFRQTTATIFPVREIFQLHSTLREVFVSFHSIIAKSSAILCATRILLVSCTFFVCNKKAVATAELNFSVQMNSAARYHGISTTPFVSSRRVS